jgi:A-macroglobulin receptor binding domain
VRYNLPKSAQKDNAFSLNTSVTNMVPGICNELYLDVNMTYNLMDESSNMAVLEVELLSGYEPEKSTLDELQHKRNLRKISLNFVFVILNFVFFSKISRGGTLTKGRSICTLTLSKRAPWFDSVL